MATVQPSPLVRWMDLYGFSQQRNIRRVAGGHLVAASGLEHHRRALSCCQFGLVRCELLKVGAPLTESQERKVDDIYVTRRQNAVLDR